MNDRDSRFLASLGMTGVLLTVLAWADAPKETEKPKQEPPKKAEPKKKEETKKGAPKFKTPQKLGESLFEALKSQDEEKFLLTVGDREFFECLAEIMSQKGPAPTAEEIDSGVPAIQEMFRGNFRWLQEAAKNLQLDWSKTKFISVDLQGDLGGGFSWLTIWFTSPDHPGKALSIEMGEGADLGGSWRFIGHMDRNRSMLFHDVDVAVAAPVVETPQKKTYRAVAQPDGSIRIVVEGEQDKEEVPKFETPQKLGEALFEALKSQDEGKYIATAATDEDIEWVWAQLPEAGKNTSLEEIKARFQRKRDSFREDYRWLQEAAKNVRMDWRKAKLHSVVPGVRKQKDGIEGFNDMTLWLTSPDHPGKTIQIVMDDGVNCNGSWKFTDDMKKRKSMLISESGIAIAEEKPAPAPEK